MSLGGAPTKPQSWHIGVLVCDGGGTDVIDACFDDVELGDGDDEPSDAATKNNMCGQISF